MPEKTEEAVLLEGHRPPLRGDRKKNAAAAPLAPAPVERKKRIRRTREEMAAAIAEKEARMRAQMESGLKVLAEKRERLLQTPEMKKKQEKALKRFEAALQSISPGWSHEHFVAAVHRAVGSSNPDELFAEGVALLERYGRPRRGRRERLA